MCFLAGKSQLGWFRYLWNAARFVRQQRPDCVILLHTLAAPLTHLLRGCSHCALLERARHTLEIDDVQPSLI